MRQASLSGTLYLPTHNLQLPLQRSHYGWSQRQDHRGRPASKVRFGSLLVEVAASQAQLTELAALAVSPHATVDGYAAFERADGQGTFVTVWFEKACLHSFTEHFDATGSWGREPSWVVQMAFSPEQMGRESGLAGSFMAPAPGEHGSPQMVGENFLQKAVNKFFPGRSTEKAPPFTPPLPYDPNDPATHFKRPTVAKALSPEVAAMIGTTFKISPTAKPAGPDGFAEAVAADLQAIYDTPTGKGLINSIRASGKEIRIEYGEDNGAGFPGDFWLPAFYQEDKITPGYGVAMNVRYNPFREVVNNGLTVWNTRPPGIGLAHELIHVEQAAYGRMRRDSTSNPGGLDPANDTKLDKAHIYELETIGIYSGAKYPFSENRIRTEWDPPQESRKYY